MSLRQRQWDEMLRKSFHPSQWFTEDRPTDYERDTEEKVMYVYRRMGDGFAVGYYDPSGEWIPEHLYQTREEASQRVHWLNGGD